MRSGGLGFDASFALGWNYAEAVRIVESEGWVLLLTVHPRFESRPFSFVRVRDDDEYALKFLECLLSVRGGEIVFEEYDSETVPTAEDNTEEETRCQEKNGKICQKSVKHVNGLGRLPVH